MHITEVLRPQIPWYLGVGEIFRIWHIQVESSLVNYICFQQFSSSCSDFKHFQNRKFNLLSYQVSLEPRFSECLKFKNINYLYEMLLTWYIGKFLIQFSWCLYILWYCTVTGKSLAHFFWIFLWPPLGMGAKNLFPFLLIFAHDGNPCYWVPGESYTVASYHGAGSFLILCARVA